MRLCSTYLVWVYISTLSLFHANVFVKNSSLFKVFWFVDNFFLRQNDLPASGIDLVFHKALSLVFNNLIKFEDTCLLMPERCGSFLRRWFLLQWRWDLQIFNSFNLPSKNGPIFDGAPLFGRALVLPPIIYSLLFNYADGVLVHLSKWLPAYSPCPLQITVPLLPPPFNLLPLYLDLPDYSFGLGSSSSFLINWE